MNFLVDGHRRFVKDGVARWDDSQIRQIFPVKYNPAASPAANQIALRRIARHVCKFPKIPERKSRGVPSIKTNRGDLCGLEQSFVDSHVHHCASELGVVNNLKAIEYHGSWRQNLR